MMLRKLYQILLLSILVFTLYFPTLSDEVSLVDDQEMLVGMFNADTISFSDIFLPHNENGGYYRPLIGISYYIDKVLWGLDIRSMHLDNVVMHLINVLLLWFILQLLTHKRDVAQGYVAFVGAALFALHPIATESLNWISGRTDPMAGNFIFAATAGVLIYKKNSKLRYIVLALAFTLFGVLAKETTLGMFVAGCFILNASELCKQEKPAVCSALSSRFKPSGVFFPLLLYAVVIIEVLYCDNYWFVLACGTLYYIVLRYEQNSLCSYGPKRILFFVTSLVSAGLLYIVLRKIAFKSEAGKIGQTVHLMMQDVNYTISLFLGALGFYVKKAILPLPLNFYILEVDPLYNLFGILLFFVCIRMIARPTTASAFALAGFCMLLPVLPFAFGTIAWTGYAERYVYISTAFWIVSAVMYCNNNPFFHNELSSKIFFTSLVALFLFFGYQTYHRNRVWQKNVTLLEDTVRQSPKAKRLRDMYMYALHASGNIEEAKKQHEISSTLYSVTYDGTADLLMAGILTQEGKMDEALQLYEAVVKNTQCSSVAPLKRLIEHLEAMLKNEDDPAKKIILLEKINSATNSLVRLAADPMSYYSLGQKALASNNKNAALEYFMKANSAFSDKSPYKKFSGKLILRIKQDLL